jgi:hypothetical protein
MLRSDSCLRADTTLAQLARRTGYATASFSSNPFIRLNTGLSRGFGLSLWGSFLEETIRRPPRLADDLSDARVSSGGPTPRLVSGSPDTIGLLRRWTRSFPSTVDLPVRVWSKINRHEQLLQPCVSTWIEPSIRKWLAGIPATQPAFCFVNYMDAHEPYVGVDEGTRPGVGLGCHWRAFSMSLGDRRRFDPADHEPELVLLKALYAESIRTIDKRVRFLLETFRTYRNLKDTWIVFVGDHGQSFGEHGQLFHSEGTDTDLFHVPLLVRPPEGMHLPVSTGSLTSTRKVHPLLSRVIQSADAEAVREGVGTAFGTEQAVWAVAELGADAVPTGRHREGQPHQTAYRLLAYVGDSRAEFDPQSGAMGGEVPSSGGSGPARLLWVKPGLMSQAQRYGRMLSDSIGALPPRTASDRITSWGY